MLHLEGTITNSIKMLRKIFQSSKIQFYIVVILFLLLPILAVFQYFWLGQLSEAETIRMQTNLQASADRFSEEFDKELTTIYKSFNEINLNSNTDNSKLLNETLLTWKKNTDLPEMISNIYAINLQSNKKVQFYELDTMKNELNKIKWPEQLIFLSEFFNQKIDNIFYRLITLTHGPILKPVPMILVAQPSDIIVEPIEENCVDNWLIAIVLNEELLLKKFIPDLEKKYFFQDNELTYNIMISKQGQVEEEFYKSRENLNFSDFTNPDAKTKLGSWRTKNMIIASAQYITEKSEVNVTKKIEKEKSLSIKVITGDSTHNIESSKYLIAKMDRWELFVKHIDGSLESIVNETRMKNLFISYIILLILGIGIVFALVYARRIQKIGQQQLEFVAGVTHELRTPLAVIQSAGENIVDGVVNSKEQYIKYGNLIRDEGKRLSKMVEKVLDFAGMQSKKQENIYNKINLNELINEIAEKFKNNSNISVEFNCRDRFVTGDKNALNTAFSNIIDNSIKYNDKTPHIDIKVNYSNKDKLYIIKIKDNGYGISENEIQKIFEPFYRGIFAKDRTIPGSGLGLSLVKGIIENHGGKISVRSELNEGTIFLVKLPIDKFE